MAKIFDNLTPELQEFIRNQKIFFVGTAGKEGLVNVSPKGMDSFRIINNNMAQWLNVTGSGNETAAHILENGRMTIMFCAFENKPLILKLYGQARAIHPRDNEWQNLISEFPPLPGARQIFELDIDKVISSCGMGVPLFDYVEDREQLNNWATKKGQDEIEHYWKDKNSLSLDGKPTNI